MFVGGIHERFVNNVRGGQHKIFHGLIHRLVLRVADTGHVFDDWSAGGKLDLEFHLGGKAVSRPLRAVKGRTQARFISHNADARRIHHNICFAMFFQPARKKRVRPGGIGMFAASGQQQSQHQQTGADFHIYWKCGHYAN